MAKDSKSTFQIIDDEGLVIYLLYHPIFKSNGKYKVSIEIFRCPVDPSIFPSFAPDGNALQSVYEAFRFTESYGVIFQCNVKYCLGPCEPVRNTIHNYPHCQKKGNSYTFSNLTFRLFVNGDVNL